MNNIDRIIRDCYCDGYFGRCYDMSGAEIIDEGDEYVVVRKECGTVAMANFQDFEFDRNEDGGLKSDTPSEVTCMSSEEKQEFIDSWCSW